jgi:hypothetical protein
VAPWLRHSNRTTTATTTTIAVLYQPNANQLNITITLSWLTIEKMLR